MAKNEQKPAIRFQGFTDAWEQRKLGHVFVEYSEKGHPELPALTIIQGGGTVRRDESERSLQYDKASLVNYKMVNAEDFIVHLRSFEGGLEKATTLGIISPAYHTFHGEGTDSRFYYSYFRSKRFIEQDLKPHVYGIRDGRSIDIEGMKTIEIPWTSYTEQQVIGNYIDTMDNLITLHQRKYDKLLSIKKSMLEKMFPRDGSKYPEIRFSGFTDPWEQRKLSALCDKFTDGDWIESKDQSDSGVRLVQTGNVGVAEYLDKPNNRKWISDDTFARLHCEEVLPGDILISRLPEPAGRACIMPVLGTKMITVVDCTIAKTTPDVSNKFLVQYLSSQAYFDAVNTCLAGGTRQRISRSNLAEFAVPIPSDKAEQEAVGSFFGNLDTLITLHQRKLEKLKNIKKSMLEKMFV